MALANQEQAPGIYTPYDQRVERFALYHLEQGRQGWDIPHTRTVRSFADQLATDGGTTVADVLSRQKVFRTAAWLHDIGYPPRTHTGMATIKADKQEHMIEGTKLARMFLTSDDMEGYLTPAEATAVLTIARWHDVLSFHPNNTLLRKFRVMDTLGSFHLGRLARFGGEPTIDKESAETYLQKAVSPGGRFSIFKTPTEIALRDEAIETYQDYWRSK